MNAMRNFGLVDIVQRSDVVTCVIVNVTVCHAPPFAHLPVIFAACVKVVTTFG